MSRFISNSDVLSTTPARRDVLTLIEAAYEAIDTEHVLRRQVARNGTLLKIQSHTYDLSHYERVFVVGCGKVACRAAAVLEEILGEYLKGGAVIGLTENVCQIISTYKGTHPLPSPANFAASSHIQRLSEQVTERDLVIAVIGGGGSALLCSSQGECDQSERLYNAFLNTGGTIDELNLVRRHLSPLKGGGLAKELHPATVVGLIFSDVVGGNPQTVASGPTYSDDTTSEDAQRIIDKYSLGTYTLNETPKEPSYFDRVTNLLIVSNETALEAMRKKATELGYAVLLPDCDPYASPLDVVHSLSGMAQPHSVVLFGGEPRLAVREDIHGSGGRNSFTVLEAVDRIAKNQVFASFASDGHDNGEPAGAIADEHTRAILKEKNISLEVYRTNRDSNTIFEMTNDLIMTGTIEANVSDLMILLTT